MMKERTNTLSKADGLPPLWTWPNTVILVSCCNLSTTTLCTFAAVIGSPFLSIAPSATIIIFNRCPVRRSWKYIYCLKKVWSYLILYTKFI